MKLLLCAGSGEGSDHWVSVRSLSLQFLQEAVFHDLNL
jgi:hypothetical protein